MDTVKRMSPKSDQELIEEFRNGKIEGFNELVRRYQEKTYWLARRLVNTHDDADDVVQDVFVRVYEGLKRFRGDSEFSTWLYRIVTNVSLNAIRTRRLKDFIRYDQLMDNLFPDEVTTDAYILHEEYQTILGKAIDKLPAKQKLVFIMRYYDELSYEEIGRILNKSVGGLKANYFHALQKIKSYVQREINS
ncbi:MAG TPA: RNA polymerase sigma factor [Bacteroidota bacterium]|nr:RNA polymerase sigma factor [Bacteroidota bacterium]